jgi:UDP-N-acetylmuramoylalanine--D-glutamate ligase
MSLRLGSATVERLLVVGFGVTGRAVCQYAVKHNTKTFLSEQRELTNGECAWLGENGLPYEDGGHTDRALAGINAIVLSPSVPLTLPLIEHAKRCGIPVYSELDLAALVSAVRPIVAVTGTNGKSSTVTLIGDLLRFCGREAPVVGNIGVPLINVADDVGRYDAIIVEVSSYQLEQSVAFRPDVGVLLNLEPDHLAHHETMEAYAEAKGRLFRLQTPDDVAILPSELANRFPQGAARRVFYDDERLSLPDGAERLSLHQRANLRAALCACEALLPGTDWRQVPIDRILAALRLPHRMEEIGFVDGVRAIDDSKATNPASTTAALAAIDGPTVLLLGGRSKGAGYEVLREAVETSAVRRIVLFGESGKWLSGLFEGHPLDCVSDVEAAVRVGLEAARPGDTLLFSPACSSFDQFCSFEERGEEFARAIRLRAGFSNA